MLRILFDVCDVCGDSSWRYDKFGGRYCIECEENEIIRTSVRKNYHSWKYKLRRKNLSEGEYDKMLSEAGGVCTACGNPETSTASYGIKKLAVDHDHGSGMVRGLLCQRCNLALGLLRDDAKMVYRLFEYRSQFPESQDTD